MKKYVIILIVLLLPIGTVSSHSGRTDSSGGHNCNVGACAGEYHYHNGGSSYTPPTTPEPEPEPIPPPSTPKSTPAPATSQVVQRANEAESKTQETDCFVATAAYGTPLASDIQTLRDFREKTLTKSIKGKLFIQAYNQVGPLAADFIDDKPLLRTIVRKVILKPIIVVLDSTRSIWT